MTDVGTRADRVAAILARFPGPVKLNVSKRKWLWFLAVGLAFAASGGWMILEPALFEVPRIVISATGWATFLFFGLGSVVIVVTLLPGASGMTLDRDGFVVCSLFRRSIYQWANVDEFTVAEVPLGQGSRTAKVVGFNDRSAARGPVARMNVALAGRNSALPDSYGLAVGELARLMSAWRLRVLRERS
jgi:hypothetical protein